MNIFLNTVHEHRNINEPYKNIYSNKLIYWVLIFMYREEISLEEKICQLFCDLIQFEIFLCISLMK